MEDFLQSQIYSPETASSQNLPPSDPMNNPPASHRIINFLTEPTPQLRPVAAAAVAAAAVAAAAVAAAAVAAVSASSVKRDYKRDCKMANSFVLVLLTISFALIATIPNLMDPDWVILHATDHTLAFTSLISCLGLFFYSLWSQPDAELAKVQGTVIGFSTVLLVLSALSRLALLFPYPLLLAMVAIVVILIGLLFLLLHFT